MKGLHKSGPKVEQRTHKITFLRAEVAIDIGSFFPIV